MASLKVRLGPTSRSAATLASALAVLLVLVWLVMVPQRALAEDDNINELKLTGPAALSMRLADRLEQARRPDEARLLRRHLLHRHVDELLGVPPSPPVTVRDAINKAALGLGNPVTDTALAARWQQAFNRHVAVRWPDAGAGLPAPWRALNPAPEALAPGAWLAVVPEGTRHLALVRLVNQSPTPLPLTQLSLDLGGLSFACRPVQTEWGGMPDPGELVLPWGERPFVCEATAAPGSKQPGLRAITASAPKPPALQLRPLHLESSASLGALVGAIGLDPKEVQRALAQQRAQALAQTPPAAAPADTPRAKPVLPPPTPPLSSVRPASTGSSRGWLALGCLLILVLAYLGKALRTRGWSDGNVNSATVVLAVLVALPFAAMDSNPGGLGGLLMFLVTVGFVIGMAVIVGLLASALRKVLELLDKAGLSFPGAVADALRRSLDFTGTASPAQFWSVFMLYGVLAAVTLAVQTSVALWVVLAVLALPMTALTVRRVRAMTWIEVLTICAVVVFIAADIFVL